MEKLTAWLKKRKLILGILVIYLLVVLAGVVVLTSSNKTQQIARKTTDTQTGPDSTQGDGMQKPGGKTAVPVRTNPVVTIENYVNQADPPRVPPSLPIYKFVTNFKLDDVLAIGNKLGFAQHTQDGDTVIVYNRDGGVSSGYLTFNLQTGHYTFKSYGDHKVESSTGVSPQLQAGAFLTNLGVIDDTVSCPITYKRRDVAGVTFVECHRSWESVGLPILSFLGLVNLPESLPLSQIKLGDVYDNSPNDFGIIETSTGQDNKARPDDFNTATVAFSSDGSVLAINSNLRQLTKTQNISIQNGLISPEEALNRLAQGNASLSFTFPSGAGSSNWEQIFPGNSASSDEAVITDYVLAYLEDPNPQEFLTPMYIFRSKTQLASGFGATLIQTVPASSIGLTSMSRTGPEVAAWWDWIPNPFQPKDAPSLKLGTFTFSPTPVQTYISADCVPAENQLNPVIQLGTLGIVGPFTIGSEGHDRAGNYFLIPASRSPLPEINSVVAGFDVLNLPERKAEVRELDRLAKEWAKNTLCPLRLSGGSPTLFTYLGEQSRISVKSNAQLTYADPNTNSGTWTVVANGQNLLVNNVARDYIYYEYKPVTFTKPQNGWVVSRSGLETLSRETIAKSLGLTAQEEDRLVFELTHAAYNIKSAKVFVGLVNHKEVEEKLPLEVSPTPDKVLRYHFYVAGTSQKQSTAPILAPISRSPFMLLELGAAKGQ